MPKKNEKNTLKDLMQASDKQIIQEFKKRVPPDIADLITKVIIFGSRAKGESRKDSDLDLAVLVSQKSVEIQRRLAEIAYDIMWEHDFSPMISLKVFAQKKFADLVARGFSFYKHVQTEGISV